MSYTTQRGSVFWYEFLIRRLIRIVPLYWVTTALFVGIAVALPGLTRRELDGAYILASLLFLPAQDQNGAISPFLGLGWTLNYEMYFYTLLTVALWLKWDPLWIVGATFGGLIIANASAPLPTPLAFWGDPIVLEFLYGVVIGHLFLRGYRLPKCIGAVLIVGGAIAILVMPVTLPVHRALAWGIPATMIFAGAVLASWRVDRAVGRLVQRLGDASYSLYLTHVFVLAGFRILLAPFVLNQFFSGALMLTACIVVALGSWAWFERPMGRHLNQVFRAAGSPERALANVRMN